MSRYAKNLVVVESPAKARTISKFLGNDYVVKASFGHVRDLPKSRLGFDPKNNFEPEYTVTPDKRKIVKELKSLIGPDTVIYLAADEDREGEAIAWHLIPTLNIQKHIIKRIVFHEITKTAILHAIQNPIELDVNMVNAQQCRRILDRAVGYKLSPLLWKKVKYGLSAGRVQSATVKIIVDKEKEIQAFIPEEFWKLKLDILSNPQFKAELSKIEGKKAVVENENKATFIKVNCSGNPYVLNEVIEKDSLRTPPAPLITSTLQQAASSKLGFGVKKTMTTAQRLYEGSIKVPGHEGGLITYMRTDSVNLSKLATDDAKSVILKEYGKEYALDEPRKYSVKGKVVAAQEAHEAIRPVDMSIKPEDIKRYLEPAELRLYTLIWARTMATQMAQAKVANTTYKILGGERKQYEFVAKGTKVLFPGFLKAYDMGSSDTEETSDDDEKFLPNVPQGTVFDKTSLEAEQNFTKPPARYSEASLVKKLETAGVGRPSTYASTINTILTREYVERTKDKKLAPTMIGTVVSDYLEEHFPNIVDVTFTANIESEFDKIAAGKLEWQKVMHDFYDNFVKNVEDKEGTDRVRFAEAIELGKDPKTGLNIIIKTGTYGSYVQLGEKNEETGEKPRIASIPKGVSTKDVSIEQALIFLQLPRIVGTTKAGEGIKVAIGMFGPYLQVGKQFYSLKEPKDDVPSDDPYTIELPRALEIIKEQDEARAKSLLLNFEKEDIKIIIGRYGPYIKAGKKNFKLPKGMGESEIRKLTLEKVKDIMKNQPTGGKKFTKKK